jgi:hypothetical protein
MTIDERLEFLLKSSESNNEQIGKLIQVNKDLKEWNKIQQEQDKRITDVERKKP